MRPSARRERSRKKYQTDKTEHQSELINVELNGARQVDARYRYDITVDSALYV